LKSNQQKYWFARHYHSNKADTRYWHCFKTLPSLCYDV